MAYQTVDAVRAMEESSGVVLEELKAYLAGVATGTWSEADVRSMWRQAARYEPSMSADRRESLLEGWRRAVEVTTRERTG
jgi:glycerol kinase